MWFHLLQRKSDDLIAVCRYAVIVTQETHYYGCEHVAALLGCSNWVQTSAMLNVAPMKQIKKRGRKNQARCVLVYWSHAVAHASATLTHSAAFLCCCCCFCTFTSRVPASLQVTGTTACNGVCLCWTLEFPSVLTAIRLSAVEKIKLPVDKFFGWWKQNPPSIIAQHSS